MTPTILLAHWKIGSLTNHRLHRLDLDPMPNDELKNEVRAFARREAHAANRTMRGAKTKTKINYRITRVNYFTENGETVKSVLITIKESAPQLSTQLSQR